MDVARLNFSHGDYADHKIAYDRVRAASNATGHAVGVLADLQGPKIRLGRFADGPVYWDTGETVRITTASRPPTRNSPTTPSREIGSSSTTARSAWLSNTSTVTTWCAR